MRITAALVALAALTLSGCGFTPLYGETVMAAGLRRIAVQTPDTRLGYSLKTALEDQLGREPGAAPAWRLATTLDLDRTPLGRRVDDTASRYELRMVVDWTLTPVSGGAPIADRTTATVTYAATDQAYASIAAQTDGEQRLAAEAARLMRLDIARRLAGAEEP